MNLLQAGSPESKASSAHWPRTVALCMLVSSSCILCSATTCSDCGATPFLWVCTDARHYTHAHAHTTTHATTRTRTRTRTHTRATTRATTRTRTRAHARAHAHSHPDTERERERERESDCGCVCHFMSTSTCKYRSHECQAMLRRSEPQPASKKLMGSPCSVTKCEPRMGLKGSKH